MSGDVSAQVEVRFGHVHGQQEDMRTMLVDDRVRQFDESGSKSRCARRLAEIVFAEASSDGGLVPVR